MKVCISSGHGKKIRGASGSPVPPQCDEVDEARRVVERTAEYLRALGVDTKTHHDDVSTSQSANLDHLVAWHNSQVRDLDCSVHFNAYDGKAHGCEVLYASNAGLEYADVIVDAICEASGLTNRGPKHRSDLAILNGTSATCVLIETAFCDNTEDCRTYLAAFDLICAAIAEAIAGEEADVRPPEPEPAPEPEPPGPMPLPPPSERRVLKKGMVGDDVAILQRALGLPWDGDFGSITHEQVKSFQAAAELGADGIVGVQTWTAIDALVKRMRNGGTELTDDEKSEIVALARKSAINSYHWPDRGPSPDGYVPGMALSFGAALKRWKEGVADAEVMASASTGKTDTDCLAWYHDELAAMGLHVDDAGPDTMRALFVIMIGLGMREASGRYCEGRDMSASNVEPETCEAALFQTSWNIATAHSSLPSLLDEFWDDPQGYQEVFKEGVLPDAHDIDCYGSGDGATYQWLAKYCPLFAVLTTGVGLRTRRQHWGPVGRREIDLRPEADALLKQVQALVL